MANQSDVSVLGNLTPVRELKPGHQSSRASKRSRSSGDDEEYYASFEKLHGRHHTKPSSHRKGPQLRRNRRSSVSILYEFQQDSSCSDSISDKSERSLPTYHISCMFSTSDENNDSDCESVLSIQSKVTAVVKDSTDDMWYLDSDDSDTIDFSSTEQIYVEEYEVASLSEGEGEGGGEAVEESDGSIDGEMIVICSEADLDFFADEEDSSNDDDSNDDTGSDDNVADNDMSLCEDFTDADLWNCPVCESRNRPLSRHCDTCWMVRPDWLRLSHNVENGDNNERKSSKENCRTDPVKSDKNSCLDQKDKIVCNSRTIDSSSNTSTSSAATSSHNSDSSISKCSTAECNDRTQEASGISTENSVNRNDSEIETAYLQKDSDTVTVNSCIKSSVLEETTTSNASIDKEKLLELRDTEKLLELSNKKTETDNCLARSSDVPSTSTAPHSLANDTRQASVLDACVSCLHRSKEASIIHGSTGHQACCYKCARRLKKKGKPCPICRRAITHVVRNYIV